MELEILSGEQALARAGSFADRLATATERPGFAAVLATDGDGRPAGIGTGFPTPHPFPTGRAYDKVRGELGDQVDTLLSGSFEIDELAVTPHARGQGLAGQLLSALCADRPACWLLTAPDAEDAIKLYERLGWTRLSGPAAAIEVFVRNGS